MLWPGLHTSTVPKEAPNFPWGRDYFSDHDYDGGEVGSEGEMDGWQRGQLVVIVLDRVMINQRARNATSIQA